MVMYYLTVQSFVISDQVSTLYLQALSCDIELEVLLEVVTEGGMYLRGFVSAHIQTIE